MKKCYVDSCFKVTNNLCHIRGLVHQTQNKMEILILKPIAHDKNLSEAWAIMMDWGRRMYAGKSYNFPSVNACLLANYLEQEPRIVSCYTSTTVKDRNNSFDHLKAIDYTGGVFITEERLKNVYIAVTLTHDVFYQINPWFDLRPYQTNLPH